MGSLVFEIGRISEKALQKDGHLGVVGLGAGASHSKCLLQVELREQVCEWFMVTKGVKGEKMGHLLSLFSVYVPFYDRWQ